ncbi:hypothetical protein [Parachlamydia sp. AcF125]|uniref:hypothetical protein n=1 Tax=Parachlamydia sp. AcF125 TaxID=2795736 RepID=UPI001BC93C31|nr:hypothetical protein [Parachlamydia sp. AcF125]MBS4168352.1 hypothetical protein [Parachlamydia sp. AcF125]
MALAKQGKAMDKTDEPSLKGVINKLPYLRNKNPKKNLRRLKLNFMKNFILKVFLSSFYVSEHWLQHGDYLE